MKFSNDMDFPDNMARQINENISDKTLEIQMLNGETEEIDENLISWNVTQVYAS